MPVGITFDLFEALVHPYSATNCKSVCAWSMCGNLGHDVDADICSVTEIDNEMEKRNVDKIEFLDNSF